MSDVEMGEPDEKKNNAGLLDEILKQGPNYTELFDELEGVLKKYKLDTNRIETRNEQFRDWITTMLVEMDAGFVGELMPQFYDLIEQLGESEYQLHISKETLKSIRKDYNDLDDLQDYNIKEVFNNKRTKNLEETSDFRRQLIKQRCKELKKQLRDSGIEWKREKLFASGEEKDGDSGNEEEKKEMSEDDMEVMNPEKCYICKISRKPFVDPCYFEECGHRYEYAAIVSLYQQREEGKQLECPILGCKATIDNISRLLKDEKTRYLTQKWLQEKKRRKDEKPVADFTLPPEDIKDAENL